MDVGDFPALEDIYVGNCVRSKYVQQKEYYELILALYMVFLHTFVHTREFNCSTQVGVQIYLSSREARVSIIYLCIIPREFAIRDNDPGYA